jgi:choline dehydrogenase-like flavoprotein
MSGTSSTSGDHDYVIVGAGSAGAVLAARLTEDPGTRVLLLEAGPEAEADEISIPAAFPQLFKTKWDWNYDTTEQKQLHNRKAYWPRMKALGGCSSMNAMIYIRGNRADYDSWRDEYGAAGWGYDDVLPWFRKAEGNTRLGGKYHGQDGPLHVEDRRYTHELTSLWVESAVSAGLKPTDDFNGAEQEGAGLYQVTCRNGRRWSVNEGYLKPVRKRENLDVETGAFATKIVVEGDRATGVTYRVGGREVTATASREVLLCGGAVNSPHLLMLSGVGPRPTCASTASTSSPTSPAWASSCRTTRPCRWAGTPAAPPISPSSPTCATWCGGRPVAPDRWPRTSGRAVGSSGRGTTWPPRTCNTTSRRPASTTTASTSRPAGCSQPRRRSCRSAAVAR